MKCFELLELGADASSEDIKAAYRRLAMLKHPDRGGDPAEFDQLRKAYNKAMAEATAPKLCPQCTGTGHVRKGLGWASINLVCPVCEGMGNLPARGNL